MTLYVFVTDFLASEVRGGAELTLESIAKASNNEYKIVKSEHLSPSVWMAPDIHWVLGNYTRLSQQSIQALLETSRTGKVKYSIIEFDYKYCIARNELVHNKHFFDQGQFGFCNCGNQQLGELTAELFNNAKTVHFMSQGQMELVKKRVPKVKGNNFRVQWSTWEDSHLDMIDEFYTENIRTISNGKWAIQQSDNWLKGTQQAIEYAKLKGLDYEVIPSMSYNDFISKLGTYKGFIFHPNAWDTCPRIVVEAKLLGLEVDINDKVQIINDPIFLKPREELMQYLRTNRNTFWDNV